MLPVLRRLCARPRHGVPLTLRGIAKATGFDHKQIHLIENTALKKLRALLPPEAREELAAMLARDRKPGKPKRTPSPINAEI